MRETYDYHMEYLRRVVPKEKLVLYDVKEWWGPLCEIFGKEVPDEPFPRANDGQVVEEFFKEKLAEGLMRWVWFVGVLVVGIGIVVYLVRL